MTIKEVEEKTGIVRSSVRFYEKEKLIHPVRNNRNGYREYTEEDVQNIKKIAYLRTLGISLENIHRIIDHEVSLQVVLERQADALESQIADLEKYHYICKKMLTEKEMTYEDLEVEAYVTELEEYWKNNSKVSRQLVALRSSASDNLLFKPYQNGSKTPENQGFPGFYCI